jgi:signal transduction histidine kinase
LNCNVDTGSTEALDEVRLRRLLTAGRTLVSQLELEAVLDQLLETAQELTGARYAALGILDRERSGLERFVTKGIDDETHRAIGDLPRGRGVLGVLIDEPHPLRLSDVTQHPLSYGFPPEHPAMRTFLGVPVLIGGKAWGNLYLTEKASGGEFDLVDEQTAVILAEWAGIAISNARLYEGVERRRQELERAVRSLEATTAIARAVGGETELPRILELIVKRGRALLESRAVVLLLLDDDGLVLAASAGEVRPGARGSRIPVDASTSGEVLRAQTPQRIDDAEAQLRFSAEHMGVEGARTALIAPLSFRGHAVGVLLAFDKEQDPRFAAEDERLMLALAASAATAVATAQTVERDKLRRTLEAAEQERHRWARELHDETLQGLAALHVLLTAAQGSDDPAALGTAVASAVKQIEQEIDALRTLITELRPAALDELGLEPALETLTTRVGAVNGLAVDFGFLVNGGDRLPGPVETTAYRIVQEALTNVAKHARADRVEVRVESAEEDLLIRVTDDGGGFAVEAPTEGFGLTGMRERVALTGGSLAIESTDDGTVIEARLPVRAGSR